MAYNLIEENGASIYGTKGYMVNTEADVATVTTEAQPGSWLYVVATANVYMLTVAANGTKQWTLTPTPSNP